jgi:hypothetical protein
MGVKLSTYLHRVPRSKNAWSYTSTPQYAFMAWCSVKKSTGTTLPLALLLEKRYVSAGINLSRPRWNRKLLEYKSSITIVRFLGCYNSLVVRNLKYHYIFLEKAINSRSSDQYMFCSVVEYGELFAQSQNILITSKNYFCQLLNVHGANDVRQT